jgi:hypothetical protein
MFTLLRYDTQFCIALNMERLFSPCTRLRDLLESRGYVVRRRRQWLQELNLEVSTEEFLSTERAFTYADLYAMLQNEVFIAWLTPQTAIASRGRALRYLEELDDSCQLSFVADGKVIVALARSPEHLVEICDVVIRLLAATVVHSVILYELTSRDDTSFNAAALAYLMQQCQSLKALTIQNLKIDENQCRELGAYSRPGLEIRLISCKLTSAGTSALAEVLGRNQGPTVLDDCDIDHSLLADGLRGNDRLKSFSPSFDRDRDDASREIITVASALKENKGLVNLHLVNAYASASARSSKAWGAICDSLETHPTLEVLDLRTSNAFPLETQAVLNFRIQALLNMMKMNMSIHTIHLDSRHSQHELFRESVVPYLAMNKHRSHIRAIQQTRPTTYRAKVLGRALLSTRTDVNSFWMLLSGNPEVSFPSTSAKTMLVTNLPTPATAAASVNTQPGN